MLPEPYCGCVVVTEAGVCLMVIVVLWCRCRVSGSKVYIPTDLLVQCLCLAAKCMCCVGVLKTVYSAALCGGNTHTHARTHACTHARTRARARTHTHTQTKQNEKDCTVC